MMHAKTAVADGRWARVGSTNLNIASWFGNCELDAVVEDESFALEMEEMYLQDLTNATEVVLDAKRKVRAPRERRHRRRLQPVAAEAPDARQREQCALVTPWVPLSRTAAYWSRSKRES